MFRGRKLAWLVLVTVALALRVLAASVRRPWHDEYFTAWVAHLSWGDLLAALRLDSGPPLLYGAVKVLGVTGIDPIAIGRAIAVAAGTLAVFVVSCAVYRLSGRTAAHIAAALLATHPLAVAWSSEGRSYSLLLLATALAWERLEKLRHEDRGGLGLATAVALGCWSHGLGLVMALAVTAACLTLPPGPRRRALVATGAGLATFLPWIPVMAAQPPASVAWMSEAWNGLPLVDRIASPVRLALPLAPYNRYLDLPSAPLAAQALALGTLLALLVRAPRRTPAWLLFGLPALALPVASNLGLPVFFPGRGEALWLAPLLGLVAAGSDRSRLTRTLAGAMAAMSLTVTAVAVFDWCGTPPRREETVAKLISDSMPAGGTVVASGYWWLDLWYHLPGDAGYDLRAYPSAILAHPGWVASESAPPPSTDLAALEADISGLRGRVAVVASPGLPAAAGLEHLAGKLGLTPVSTPPGGVVYLPPTVPVKGLDK